MDKIVVVDFGGQYAHLIARRIRELGVYSEVKPSTITKQELLSEKNLKGIIFSGGAASVMGTNAPRPAKNLLLVGVPILGICYGHHLIAFLEGGKVTKGAVGEYGPAKLFITKNSPLFYNLNSQEIVWMNHQDIVTKLPPSYYPIAYTDYTQIAAYENPVKKIFAVQFHPEVTHTKCGRKILENFIFRICLAEPHWRPSMTIGDIIKEAKSVIANRKAIIALSGGIDSSTAAVLVKKAIGEKLIAVYVDTGLMRHNEEKLVTETFTALNLNIKIVKAQNKFFRALKGITNPEEKRKIIGRLFIELFENVARKEKAQVLVQGTIYSDRIESGTTQHSAVIKSHHNVGGLPKKLSLEIYEPLRNFYKDEVRKIARKLGLPNELIKRHVFPGPGFAVRILGEVTPQKVAIVRRATKIVEDELKAARLYEKVWMAFCVLLPHKSVGIQGDARSYKFPIVLRIVASQDAMTANYVRVPYSILERIVTRITNEIKEVNRVVYDITNKPPATMEWE
jgi:GMP synthase (glutamine-hydrolysing)